MYNDSLFLFDLRSENLTAWAYRGSGG